VEIRRAFLSWFARATQPEEEGIHWSLRWAFIALIVLFPVVFPLSSRANNVCFFLLFGLSLIVVLTRRRLRGATFFQFLWTHKMLCLLSVCALFAVFLNQLMVAGFRARDYDMPFHFFALPFLIYALSALGWKDLRHIQWGWFVSVLLSCAVYVFSAVQLDTWRFSGVRSYATLLIIPFVNQGLLTACLVFLTTSWDRAKSRILFFLRCLVGLLGVALCVLSGNRGGWLLFPFIVWIVYVAFPHVGTRKKMTVIVVGVCVVLAFFFVSDSVRERVRLVGEEITQYTEGGNRNTSIGFRLQWYRAAPTLIAQHGLFGMGEQHYDRRIQEQDFVSRGVWTEEAKDPAHFHNDFLQWMILYGMVGGVFALLLWGVPLCYFFRHIRSTSPILRGAALMGVLLGIAYAVFGLTDAFTSTSRDGKLLANYYVLTFSVLLAILLEKRHYPAKLG
jgi:O-antigen ligase